VELLQLVEKGEQSTEQVTRWWVGVGGGGGSGDGGTRMRCRADALRHVYVHLQLRRTKIELKEAKARLAVQDLEMSKVPTLWSTAAVCFASNAASCRRAPSFLGTTRCFCQQRTLRKPGRKRPSRACAHPTCVCVALTLPAGCPA
jgi:hypothetical protein